MNHHETGLYLEMKKEIETLNELDELTFSSPKPSFKHSQWQFRKRKEKKRKENSNFPLFGGLNRKYIYIYIQIFILNETLRQKK